MLAVVADTERPLIRAGRDTGAPQEPADGCVGSDEVAARVRALSGVSVARSGAAIVFDWSVIVSCFACAMYLPYVGVWVAVAAVIASRQHALLILMHDGAHYRLLPNRQWNDRVSNWLLAWPLFVSTEGYRQNHLAHHMYLNTDDDPDWTRKYGKREWTFPKTRWGLILLLGRDLIGGGLIEALRSIVDLSGGKLRQASRKSSGLERLAFYAVAAGSVAITGLWRPVLLLWFLPAFTLLPVILRVRSIAEHFGVEGENELNASRNTHARWWERFLFAPHNSGYHLDHHLYPSVPFYNLPKLHAVLRCEPGYATMAHQSETLFGGSRTSFLSEVTSAG